MGGAGGGVDDAMDGRDPNTSGSWPPALPLPGLPKVVFHEAGRTAWLREHYRDLLNEPDDAAFLKRAEEAHLCLKLPPPDAVPLDIDNGAEVAAHGEVAYDRGIIAHRVVALAHELDVVEPTEPHADALAHVTRVTTRAKRESSEIAPAELRGGSNFAGVPAHYLVVQLLLLPYGPNIF